MEKTPAMPDTNFPWQKSIDVVETIKRLVKDNSYDLATPQTYGEFRALALMAAQELEATRSRWISVEERLPEAKGQYLVCGKHWIAGLKPITTICYWSGERWDINKVIEIAYWMPLPEPPKEEVNHA